MLFLTYFATFSFCSCMGESNLPEKGGLRNEEKVVRRSAGVGNLLPAGVCYELGLSY